MKQQGGNMESSVYNYRDFLQDVSEVVDTCYPERVGDLARFTGAKLSRGSSNPSPAGALLEILESQTYISDGNVELLCVGFEGTNMTKATEITKKYMAAISPQQSKVDVFKNQLIETYKRLCYGNTQSDTEDHNFDAVPMTSLPSLTLCTDPSHDGRKMSRHFIFEQRQPEQPNVLLIGQSGSGKTTVCYRLLHDWLTRNEDSSISDFDLVVYTSLSHVSITDSLVDSIRHNLLSADTDLTDGDIDGILKSHVDSLLLIFDSLDDINLTDLDLTDHSTTLTIGKLLTSDQLPLVTKLITSSSSAVDDLFHGLDVHIAGLDNAQMRDYVAGYFLNEPMIGANILHHITKSVVTSDFCRLPLLLRMVCDIAKRPNSINIAEVMHMHVFYSFVIQNEFGKYCEEHGADSAYFVQFSRLLGHLALEMLLKNQSVDFQEKRILTADERAMIGLGLKAGFVKQVEVVSRGLDGSVTRVTFIRFKYMVIQQFFAAARLAEIADECPERFETILDNITKVPSLHYLMLFLCGNSAPCCRAILKRVHKQEEFRLLMSEYLYEYQEANDECSQILSVLRWLNTNICFRGEHSQYQQRATFSLVQRMKNAKINISSVHLNDVTSSLCLELMKVGAPILSLTISDVALTLFRDLPACPSLRKLQISEVDVNDEDLLQVFKWVAKQPKLICLVFQGSLFPGRPSTHFISQLSEIANLTKCKVFKEEDGDSLSIYSQLNSETYQWHFTSALDFCKYQFENGLMHEMELRRRTKQPNLISEKYLDANCIPHTNCDDSFVVPEIVLEDLDGECEEEAQETGNETQWTEDHESLLTAQQSLHAGKISVNEFMQYLQRLHAQQMITISQYLEEIRILRNTERIDDETCFHMILSAGDAIQDHAESISFLEDVRQLVRFQKITTSQLFQICRHLIIKAQLPADYYVEIITGMKERKEIKKDQFVSEIDALKHLKLIGQLAYIKLRLTH